MVAGLVVVAVVSIAGIAMAAPVAGWFRGVGRGGMWGFGFPGAPGAGKIVMKPRASPGGCAAGCADLVKELGLTDEQLAKIREIRDKAFEDLRTIQGELFEKMHELQDLCWQKEPDQGAIDAKRGEIQELRQRMATINKQMQDEIKAVLTQEQLDSLNQVRGARIKQFRRGVKGSKGAPNPAEGATSS
jgi:Spy/CpxP family protein refolding chaperone